MLRRYALYRNVLNIPNARSSHSVPTPRGGGIAVVASAAIAHLLSQLQGNEGGEGLISLLVIALTGFVDDHTRKVQSRLQLSAPYSLSQT